MKKLGFTMIELIFVIVVLGILAAIAMPKFAATRDDAKVVAIAKQIQSAIQEIHQYVISQGGEANSTTLTIESQVLKQLVSQKKAKEVNKSGVIIYGDNKVGCVIIETNSTSLKLETNTSATGQICIRLKTLVKDATYTIAGSIVKF